MPTYEATYTFGGHTTHGRADSMERLLAAVDEFQDDGVDLDHLGTTVTLDATGRVELVVSRYRASTQRYVGWHGWVAQLPVSGIRRLESTEATEQAERSDSRETLELPV